MAKERIIEEFKDLNRNPLSSIWVNVYLLNEDNYFEWGITLLGPKDSCYKDGIFYLKASFSKDYPNKAPIICFITPIYHIEINPKNPKKDNYDYLES